MNDEAIATKVRQSPGRRAPLERNVTRSILKRLEQEADVYVFKTVGGFFGRSGVPDLFCCVAGRFVAMEVKRPGMASSTTSALQRVELERIVAAGGVAGVVRSVSDALILLSVARALNESAPGAS